jgi:hydroxymethylpyrimidine pyrophosphatase-like HAD family hydrolase
MDIAMSFRSTGACDLVICDIDGCISPESHAPIDGLRLTRLAEHNELALRQNDRPLVTLCSGRPIGFVEAMCRLIHNSRVPCIGENGVWMWLPDENSFEIDPAITDEQLQIVHEASTLLRSQYESEGVVLQPGKTAAVSLYHVDTDYLRSIMPAISDEFERRGWPFRVSMTWLYINCDLQHVNKGTAIDRLLARTGIDAARTTGIGDTMSDRFIADRVAWFACPANADAEIKQQADYVSEFEEIDGVLDILRKLSE